MIISHSKNEEVIVGIEFNCIRSTPKTIKLTIAGLSMATSFFMVIMYPIQGQ